jgi:hypothetical protein
MRTALVALFASLALSYGLPAHAQESSDAQRLHDAAFASRPFSDPLYVPQVPYGTLKVGLYSIESAYTVGRLADSWRVPESGQGITQTQYEFRMYAESHPLFKFGAHALMRSGRHESESNDRFHPIHIGREPDEQKYMVDLAWLFSHK